MKKPLNILTFTLLILTGLCILSPYFDYQPWLSQGDHGLNLYAAEASMRGERPYHDYYWFYGPLMPYYYALFFKIFGVKITSAILGQILLNLLSGCFIYAALSLFVAPLISFCAAIWFWAFTFNFNYTYNHFGGITLSIMLLYYHFRYIKTAETKNLYGCLLIIFVLSFIKINIGLAALAAFFLSVSINNFLDRSLNSKSFRNFSLSALIGVPFALLVSHYYLLKGLPFHIIKQGFQYFGTDPFKDNYPSLFESLLSLPKLLLQYARGSILQFAFCLLLLVCIIKIVTGLKSSEKSERKAFLLTVSSLLLYYVFLLHEYLISGIFYRRLWGKPFLIALCFLLIGFTIKKFNKNLIAVFAVLILILPIKQLFNNNAEINKFKVPYHYMPHPKGNIYYKNAPMWTSTIHFSLDFIEKNLKKDELFFALPYEPLYYFLSGRPSPTRQLAFFDFVAIPDEQEQSIIKELEDNKVNWILMSNRHSSTESGLGTFGESNCPLLGEYIKKNFTEVHHLGEWRNFPGWAWNHGVKFLKRTSE